MINGTVDSVVGAVRFAGRNASEPIAIGPPDGGVGILCDVHLLRIEKHRGLRRLAGQLLPDYLPLSTAERNLIFRGAAMLVRMRDKNEPRSPDVILTREAGQLFSRLPDDPRGALATLKILEKLLAYIDDGVIDLSDLASHVQVIERAVVLPKGHLKLVEDD